MLITIISPPSSAISKKNSNDGRKFFSASIATPKKTRQIVKKNSDAFARSSKLSLRPRSANDNNGIRNIIPKTADANTSPTTCLFSPLQGWGTPDSVAASETRENAQRGVPCRSSDAIPNHSKEKPHRRNDEARCLVVLFDYSFTLVPSSSGSQRVRLS